MLCNILLATQLGSVASSDNWWLVLSIGAGVLLFALWIGAFLVPVLIWRRSVRRRGYPGLRAYLRALPQTEEEKLDALDLTLKGGAICLLGLLIPPLVLIGLVPLYYGARKLASVKLGITGAHDNSHTGRSQ